MTYQFKVGEYKTKDNNAVVVLEVYQGCLYGRRRLVNGEWVAAQWYADGSCLTRNHNLVPPVREIWMVSWLNKNGTTDVAWCANMREAKQVGWIAERTLIAITGPHEVPA